MAGHEILNSCHNCGASNVHLNIVKVGVDDRNHEMGCADDYHHIHVFAACDRCKRSIWDISKIERMMK